MTIEQAIGRTVTEARLARGWSMAELGRRVGCHYDLISDLETGKWSWSTMRDTAQALRMSPGALISLAESLQPQYEARDAMQAEIRQKFNEAA